LPDSFDAVRRCSGKMLLQHQSVSVCVRLEADGVVCCYCGSEDESEQECGEVIQQSETAQYSAEHSVEVEVHH